MVFEISRRRVMSGALASLLLSTAPAYAATANPVVRTKFGSVRGIREGNVFSFRRIPYAANPFLPENRFRAPQPMRPWSETRDAGSFGLPPPQPNRGVPTQLFGGTDDLTLNIWTPDPAAKGLPVMVWIPGGAFIRGDAGEANYNGSRFAADGIVLVTINYRVGADGFLQVDGMPANRGILDQVAALEWVQENIAAFGGDPANITLFGQSAGAESVAILLGMSRTKGLFHRAIIQSAPMQSVTRSQATELGAAFAKDLGVAPTPAALAGVPFPKLVEAVVKLGQTIKDRERWGKLSWGGTAFLPVVDGDVLEAAPLEALAHASRRDIPVIVGCTDDEARLYLVPGGAIDRISSEALELLISDFGLPADTAEVYARDPFRRSTGDIFAAATSDYTFRMPSLRIAEMRAANRKTWFYNFAWRSPANDGRLGAAHFADVPFTFGTEKNSAAAGFVGNNPPASLVDAMHSAWGAFAKTGTPGWTPYDLESRPTMRFDVASSVVDDPRAAERLLWEGKTF